MGDSQNTDSGFERSPAYMFRHRFVILLCALTLLLISTPFVHLLGPRQQPILTRFVVTMLFAGLLLSAVFAVSSSRLTSIIAVSLAAPAIILGVLTLLVKQDWIDVATHLLDILFLGYTVVVILGSVFSSSRVTIDTISAALCVYLLLGVLWSIVFSLLETIDHDSFAYTIAEDGNFGSGDYETGAMRFGAEGTVFALYYSFVTITTLGYGDVVPISPAARMFAAIEAIMGQLYLAVLVARLVGLHISHSSNRGDGLDGR